MCHRLGPVVAHPVFRVTDVYGTIWSQPDGALASSLGRITSRAEAGGRPSCSVAVLGAGFTLSPKVRRRGDGIAAKAQTRILS